MNMNNKGANDSLFSTWKDSNDLNEDGTALWNKLQGGGGQNARWKEDDMLMNKSKLNNMTNQCANGINLNLNLNAHMQNGFSSASPGVLRIPSANSMNNSKLQMQPNAKAGGNWLDGGGQSNSGWSNENKNGLNGQPNNGLLWNENAQQVANNWNKPNLNAMNNNNDDWKLKKEMIMQSQQFKVLADKGFRKENIEAALRNSNMNIKDAIDELRSDILKENINQTMNDFEKRKNSAFNHPSSLPPNSSISNRNTSQFSNQMSQQVGIYLV